jgi:hypothetical protein
MLLLVFTWYAQTVPLLPHTPGPNSKQYPFEALEYINQEQQTDTAVVVAAHPNLGGFITYYGRGRLKAIIDDRNRMLGEARYREMFTALQPDADWRAYLERYHVDFVLLSPEDPFAAHLRETQALPQCFSDSKAVLFSMTENGCI